jgi:hypothetical protein
MMNENIIKYWLKGRKLMVRVTALEYGYRGYGDLHRVSKDREASELERQEIISIIDKFGHYPMAREIERQSDRRLYWWKGKRLMKRYFIRKTKESPGMFREIPKDARVSLAEMQFIISHLNDNLKD